MKSRNVLAVAATFTALIPSAAGDNCSCWGGGFIVGATAPCGGAGGTGEGDGCQPGYTLWCRTASPGCSPIYMEQCCPNNATWYFGCRNEYATAACCSGGAPAWEWNEEFFLWLIDC